jgi:hypothetical protein
LMVSDSKKRTRFKIEKLEAQTPTDINEFEKREETLKKLMNLLTNC